MTYRPWAVERLPIIGPICESARLLWAAAAKLSDTASEVDMKATHKAMIHVVCPNGGWDYYEIEVETWKFLEVERITEEIQKLAGLVIYQEELTENLAESLGAKVTTRGRHGTTDTEVTAE